MRRAKTRRSPSSSEDKSGSQALTGRQMENLLSCLHPIGLRSRLGLRRRIE